MKCLRPLSMRDRTVGCGQCMPCRINRGRVWTGRILLESLSHPAATNFFATFTYEDDELPKLDTGEPTLDKSHGAQFRMDLRNTLGEQPRFFWVGEYGDQTQRPHYHAVFFGLPTTEPLQLLQDHWERGFVTVDYLNETRARYVAGYVTKKLTGRADPLQGERLREYSQMSRRPALADGWVSKTAEWLKTPSGARWLEANGDVPHVFRTNGTHFPLGDRHRRRLRAAVGLPERKLDLYRLRPETYMPPEPIPGELELAERERRYSNYAKRKAIYTQGRAAV